MFPFWELAIAPVFEALKARRVVEVGALRGDTTVRMLEALGPDAELHVVDPAPEFDPAEHERAFPGRYIFHRDLSLNVLSDLGPVDVALIDGDHNWYTVFHELGQLTEAARSADAALPVMILHDVCWPYGRRDLYYAPDTIPDEFRQPYAQRGIARGKKKLLPRGGLNPAMYNARLEGGQRNGVMTGLEDWMACYDRPLRRVVLPIYFGLAIVAEEERLEREPALAEVLDHLESADGRMELLRLSEDVRLEAMVFQHNVFSNQEQQLAQAARRYLDILKAALLDEHYIENELRLHHLSERLTAGKEPQPAIIRDPARHLRGERVQEALVRRRAGALDRGENGSWAYFPYATMGRVRLDALEACLDAIRPQSTGLLGPRGASVEGDLVECGTDRGGGAIFLRGYLDAYQLADPVVYVADEFRASPHGPASSEPNEVSLGEAGFPQLQADLNTVRDGFHRFGLLDDRVRFLQGRFEETLPDAPIQRIALLRLGATVGSAAGYVLDELYDSVSVGGFVVVDGAAGSEARTSVEEFRVRRGVEDPIEQIDASGFRWRKSTEPVGTRQQVVEPERRDRAPLAPPTPSTRRDLSIVVVFYNMRREAQRTLRSLSRAYQEGVDDLDYEVIVVENGSDPDERLGNDLVASFGPEFRYVDMGPDAPASPVEALNAGIRAGGGENFALMIDGAHVVTPGVLHYGQTALRTYAPTVVATQQWYVGPGQQGDSMFAGYDEAYEDNLFEQIDWPRDGYRLFEISHFIGDRDWFDGIWESNCLFVPRSLLEQVGCFDESFSMPSGGYANLELFERLAASPDVRVSTILGEGSFHQIHGGTTTNEADADERRRRVAGYAQHYAEIRGRAFRGPGKPLHYVGSMRPWSKRTKARRRLAPKLFNAALPDPDGIPEQAAPIPEELRQDFIESFWRSLAWRKTTWLGHRTNKAPTDLVAYQELVTSLEPDWIIEIRSGNGARALFFASICELLDHGQVISIDVKPSDQRPRHPRITYVTGNAVDEGTVDEVRRLVGDDPSLVVFGARASSMRILAEFRAYAPFVPVGSYIVVEDTIVSGHPVWQSFGAGPMEAVTRIVGDGEFAPDPSYEKYGLTFNPSGYLKRLE